MSWSFDVSLQHASLTEKEIEGNNVMRSPSGPSECSCSYLAFGSLLLFSRSNPSSFQADWAQSRLLDSHTLLRMTHWQRSHWPSEFSACAEFGPGTSPRAIKMARTERIHRPTRCQLWPVLFVFWQKRWGIQTSKLKAPRAWSGAVTPDYVTAGMSQFSHHTGTCPTSLTNHNDKKIPKMWLIRTRPRIMWCSKESHQAECCMEKNNVSFFQPKWKREKTRLTTSRYLELISQLRCSSLLDWSTKFARWSIVVSVFISCSSSLSLLGQKELALCGWYWSWRKVRLAVIWIKPHRPSGLGMVSAKD